MRRDKTAARIILILSVVHVAVAAPPTVLQCSLDVDEDVTPTLEKRGNPVGDTSQDLYPVPQMDNELPTTSSTPQLHNDQPQISEPPPSQDNTSEDDLQFHNDPSGSEYPQLQSPWSQHRDSGPTGETVQGESSAHLESWEPVHVYDDMSESGMSDHELLTDFPGTPSSPPMNWGSSSWSESPPSWLLEHPSPPPEADGLFSETMKQKLKFLAGFGAVAAVSAGLAYGVHKLIKEHSHHGAYVFAFFPPSPADHNLTESQTF